MRTTLTIDDDVAVRLDEQRKQRQTSLKEVVNDALRRGLQQMNEESKGPRKTFRTRTFDSVPLVSDVDDIAEVIAYAEGEDFK